MCSFRFNFSDVNVLFFKKIKNCCSLPLKKNNLLCKNRKKITCHEEKSQPPWISNGPYIDSASKSDWTPLEQN